MFCVYEIHLQWYLTYMSLTCTLKYTYFVLSQTFSSTYIEVSTCLFLWRLNYAVVQHQLCRWTEKLIKVIQTMFNRTNVFRPEENYHQMQQSVNRSDDLVRFCDVCFEDIKFQSFHVGVKYKFSLQGYMLVYKYE